MQRDVSVSVAGFRVRLSKDRKRCRACVCGTCIQQHQLYIVLDTMAGDIECNWCCEAASYRVSLPLIGLSAKLYPLLQTIVLVVSMAALLCMLNRSCKCLPRSRCSPHLPCCHCCCGNGMTPPIATLCSHL